MSDLRDGSALEEAEPDNKIYLPAETSTVIN